MTNMYLFSGNAWLKYFFYVLRLNTLLLARQRFCIVKIFNLCGYDQFYECSP